jgi:phenylacetate-coenzyme A ligase PaaK-like adenylate-forming protein
MTATVRSETASERRHAAVRAALPDHVERLTWSRERIEGHQRNALRGLLRHALAHSPFHTERLAGVDADGFELADLAQLPTMTKTQLMASFDYVVTDPRLRRALVERHLATAGAEPVELLGEYLAIASGGSSGERGVYVLSRAESVDYLLGITRAAAGRILAMGGPPPGGVPMSMVAAGSAVHATRALPALFTGDIFDIESTPVTAPLEWIVERLNARRSPLLYGYASILGRLAAEQDAGRLHIAPMVVTSTSEHLEGDSRARIQAAFGAPVVDGFASSEGLVGSSPPGEPEIALATDLAIVELVDEANRPVAPGVPSAKALVTNLFNRTQPLIRYELPDRFVRLPDTEAHGHMRVSVDGRADDLLRFGDVVVHPLVVRSVLVSRAEIVEYQVRQTPRGVDVDVVAPGGTDEAALARALEAALRGAGLHGAEAAVECADAISRDPSTGKARRFVPLAA